METIIGLLVVLLPVIFKLIGKRLEQAGEQPSVLTENFPEIEQEKEERVLRAMPEVMSHDSVENPASVVRKKAPKVQPTKVAKPVKPVTKVLMAEAAAEKKKEKIDVKKMIVYSEIMKPKYME
jgi:hypothetical protein